MSDDDGLFKESPPKEDCSICMLPMPVGRAMKHFMIAAKSGLDDSLKNVGHGYKQKWVTKDEYASTLRAHQRSRDEMKSEQRTKAASAS